MIIRMFGTVFIFLIGIALPLACEWHSPLAQEPISVQLCLVIVIHATARIPTSKIKAENVLEKLSLQTTPMGFLLGWLGAQNNDQSSSTMKRQ